MSFDVAGKHAIVTGGGRGIGLAIARALAARGAVVSAVSRTVRDANTSAAMLCEGADVTSEEQVKRAFEACRARNGPVAILVNNSGIAESAPLIRTGLAMWERIMATNVTGTFLCSRDAAEDMIVAKSGRIVNVASIAGLGGAAYISAYCASKHAVVGFTRAIAAEFEGTGITANCVCPGYTETDMMRHALENIKRSTGASEEDARERLAGMNPHGRIATVEEVAEGVLELITGDRNGAALVIPGNMYE
ncbi:MAG: SDR family oxidoreductase [Candidatus Eremiobacteraeota bacterium]|nr:SDR family oxidoreductase [Candidatus Eremiobacteraeota bacterium]